LIDLFKDSPFSVLGISIFDTKQKIVDVAEFHSGAVNHEEVVQAKSALIHSRLRIAAEVAWLPGVSLKKTAALTLSPPLTIAKAKSLHSIPTLAYANVIGEVLVSGHATISTTNEYAEWIILLSLLVEAIDVEDATELINSDREVSGFPRIRDEKIIEEALGELYAKHATAVMKAVCVLPIEERAEILADVTIKTTTSGSIFAPHFIDLLVDRYEISISNEIQIFNDWVEEQINLIKKNLELKRLALAGRQTDILIEKLKWWAKLVKSLQIIAKSKHIKHKGSESIASRCRSLSISMCNDYEATTISNMLTSELLEIFSDTPERLSKFVEDSEAIKDILESRKKKRLVDQYWDEDHFDDKQSTNYISINEKTIETNLTVIEVDSITGIRWWKNRNLSTNSYWIGLTSSDQSVLIAPKHEETYEEISDCLWNRFVLPISADIIKSLLSGRRIGFGCIEVSDSGIYFPAYKKAPSQCKILVHWKRLAPVVKGEDGLYFCDKDEIYNACIDFTVTNVLVLHALIALVVEVGAGKLSDFSVVKQTSEYEC
jgi:hypothetical protein